MYDLIVLGGGIAGVTIASLAAKEGKKTLLLEKETIEKSASVAAGAFLSPKFGPKSKYNQLIDKAFIFSVDFFKNSYPQFLDQCGMLRVPRGADEQISCGKYAKNSDFWKRKEFRGEVGYFCEDAATIDPLPTMIKMLEGCEYKEGVGELSYEKIDDCWQVGEYRAKHLVLATGAKLLVKNEPYIKIKPIFGQKLSARVKSGYDFHLHRGCSVSAYRDGKVLIGATHIPGWRYEDSETLFSEHRDRLIREANALLQESVEIFDISGGFRSSTTDYFPIAGEVINMQETLKLFPALYHGVRVDEEKFIYHKNLWIHSGHGARAFVLAPYTAQLLYKQMFKEEIEDKSVTLARQLIRYARKIKL